MPGTNPDPYGNLHAKYSRIVVTEAVNYVQAHCLECAWYGERRKTYGEAHQDKFDHIDIVHGPGKIQREKDDNDA